MARRGAIIASSLMGLAGRGGAGPVLSALSTTESGFSVTINGADGTLYWVLLAPGSTAPTAAQVIAAKDGDDNTAIVGIVGVVEAGSVAISSAGTKTPTYALAWPYFDLYVVHQSSGGVKSAVVNTSFDDLSILAAKYSAAMTLFDRPNPSNSNQWTTTGKTTLVSASGDSVGYYASRAAGANDLQQATAGTRPTVANDGNMTNPTWDHHLSGSQYWTSSFIPGAAMTMVVAGRVPDATASVQAFMGGQDSANTRCFIAVDSSAGGGRLGCGWGAQSTPTINQVSDNSGRNVVALLRVNGSTVNLHKDGVSVYSAAPSGSPGTVQGLAFGGNNNAGTVGSILTGIHYFQMAIKAYLSDADCLLVQLRAAANMSVFIRKKTDLTDTSRWNEQANIVRLPSGVLILFYNYCPNAPTSITKLATGMVRFSADNGVTWTAENTYLDGQAVTGFPMIPPGCTGNQGCSEIFPYLCPNGDIIVQTWKTDYSSTKTAQQGTWQARCTDGIGKVWETTMTRVNFTDFPVGYSYNQDYIFATDDQFVVGSTIYAGARMLITTGAGEGDAAATGVVKSLFIKSTDNGVTWAYVSDISSWTSTQSGANGTIEVGFIYRGGSDITAIIRGQIGDPKGYKSISADMGATWNGGTQTVPGALTDITAQTGHTGRPMPKSFARLKGQANWWTDPNIAMCGFTNTDAARRPCIWISRDFGATWSVAYVKDAANGANLQGYGDIAYDSTRDLLLVFNTSYNSGTSKRAIRQYDVRVAGL